MEEILAQAKKLADQAEVFTVTSENTPIQFETNRLKHAQTHQSTSVALRVVKQGRMGYSTGTQTDDVTGLVNSAIETAQFGTECHFDFPSLAEYPQVKISDPATQKVPLDVMIKLGDELISTIRTDWPDLMCQAWISKGETTVKIANTSGGQVTYKQTHFNISISGTLIRGTDMLFVGDGESSCHPILKTTSLLTNVKKQLEWSRDLATITSGSLPVIFTPSGIASALILPLMTAFNGKTVMEGASPIGSQLGQVVFSPKITLSDDPTLSFRPSSRPCDDEGVASQRTPLIKRGVVTNFLYDLQTAGLAGKHSTGSASRGRGLPSPSPSAFVFTAGKISFEDMVSDMKDGLIVEELMGAEQGNILGGDFSGNVLLGFRVENGKIVGRVKNTMVSGNVYQLLKNVAAVGNDGRWLGGLYTPSLFFPGISVASK
jgi:PmbA protein